MAGRGWGKTRVCAEWCARKARKHPGCRIALVAEKFADGRDTMVEGESGLLTVFAEQELRGGSQDSAWNRSMGELFLENGSRFKIYSSEKPGQLRGPQHHFAWCDELAKWKDANKPYDALDTTWSNLMLGLRIGERPQCVIATTPKPVKLLTGTKEKPGIARWPDVRVSYGTTYQNLENLAPSLKRQVLSIEGTRLAAQELQGQLLEIVQGALWHDGIIGREKPPVNAAMRIVVGVDPNAGEDEENEELAETGIVVVGYAPSLDKAYVLADYSVRGTPDVWGPAAIRAYREFNADVIVAEKNQGGAMVTHTLRVYDRNANIKTVWAATGKRTRAEPVSGVYDQGRVHHVEYFHELEEQMCTWVPDMGIDSPDRMDALVWALSELVIMPGRVEQISYVDDYSEPVYKRGDLVLVGEKYVDRPSPDY